MRYRRSKRSKRTKQAVLLDKTTCFQYDFFTMAGFELRSDFDHHLRTFLVMVQCKRKVNTSREVTAAELVDLRRATELFREVVPLLRAELEELKVELLGKVSKRKPKKVVTFAEDQQTNPFLERSRQLEDGQETSKPSMTVGNPEVKTQQSSALIKTQKKPTPIDWNQIKTYKPRTQLPPCYLCGGNHSLSSCGKFRQQPVAERLHYVQRNKLCLNCFSRKHHVTNCGEVARCRACAGLHSTLLHLNK